MTALNAKSVLIVAGGTGGHIYPALAIAERLKHFDIGIHWLGSQHGMESRIVPSHGIEISKIRISALRGRGWWRWCLAPLLVSYAVFEAIVTVLRVRPQLVLGMGGFVTGPGGIAAWLCRVPLVIHEQNAIAGFTNRVIAPIAARVLAGYPRSFRVGSRAVVTGNPVRESISQLPSPATRIHDATVLRILVVGGSLGAHRLNQTVPDAISMTSLDRPIQVWHQTGARDVDSTLKRYREHGIAARVDPFIVEMAEAYVWADIVICRAGAITVAELAASGVASILIPFPHAVDDHQAANASYLTERGAAIMIREAELTAHHLQQLLTELCADRGRLLLMACRARESAMPNATNDVATHCLEILSV